MATTVCRANDMVFNECSQNTNIKINNLKKYTGASKYSIDVHVFVEEIYRT